MERGLMIVASGWQGCGTGIVYYNWMAGEIDSVMVSRKKPEIEIKIYVWLSTLCDLIVFYMLLYFQNHLYCFYDKSNKKIKTYR